MHEHIVRVVQAVAALCEHGTAEGCVNPLRRFHHIRGAANRHPGQYLTLRNVRCDHRREREQLRLQCIDCIVTDQLRPAGGDHHRVHHDVSGLVECESLGDHLDEAARGNHPCFHCIRIDIRKNHIELILQEIRRRLHDTLYAGRILGSQCRNRAHRIHVICEHCLDICLDAGASTGVTSCDC